MRRSAGWILRRLALGAAALAAFLGGFALGSGDPAPAAPEPLGAPLAGAVIEARLQPGGTPVPLALRAGEAVQVELEQGWIDLRGELRAAGGARLRSLDLSDHGVERWTLLPAGEGTRLVLSASLPPGTEPPVYRLTVRRRGVPRPADRRRVEAEDACTEAKGLSLEFTGPSARRAVARFDTALGIWQELADEAAQDDTLQAIAGLLAGRLQETRRALPYFEQLLALRRAKGNQRGEAVVLGSLGVSHLLLGDVAEGRERLEESLALARKTGAAYTEGLALQNLASADVEMGRLDVAETLLRQALEIWRRQKVEASAADAVLQLGEVAERKGEPEEALAYYRECRSLASQVGYPRAFTRCSQQLGALLLRLGREGEGRAALDEALASWRRMGDRRGEATALAALAEAEARSGRRRSALSLLEQALDLWRAVEDPWGESQALRQRAELLRQLGDLEGARRAIGEALERGESLRAEIQRRDLQSSFLASRREQYDLALELDLELHRRRPDAGYDIRAFSLSEQARARGLLDLLREARVELRRSARPELRRRLTSLAEELDAGERYRRKLVEQAAPAAELESARREVQTRLDQYEELWRRMRKESPQWANLMRPEPIRIDDARALLGADTLLLEYALAEPRSALWAVSEEGHQLYELPPRSEITAAVRRVYRLLMARDEHPRFETPPQRRRRIADSDAALPDALSALTAMLLPPGLPDRTRLLIVPDGVLHYLPFAVLGDLAESREVTVLPSAAVLCLLQHAPPRRRPDAAGVAILADPVFSAADPRLSGAARRGTTEPPAGSPLRRLPASRDEARAIAAAAAPRPVLLALGADASVETVRGQASRYAILHFATHGLVDSREPELSAIALSSLRRDGEPVDGMLRLHDIYDLDLSARLVVLSGCRTGLGQEVRGEGLVGLTRGFLYAGAAQVLVTLWDVDDRATAALMASFYEGLFGAGLRPEQALRDAQRRLRRTSQWGAPYYWAGFILVGAPWDRQQVAVSRR